MTAHTPGPWKWMSETDFYKIEEPHRYFSLETPDGGEVVTYAGCGTHHLEVANPADAALIAAAPDLLEALEKAPCTCTGNCKENACYRNVAGRAIAKAKGEQ